MSEQALEPIGHRLSPFWADEKYKDLKYEHCLFIHEYLNTHDVVYAHKVAYKKDVGSKGAGMKLLKNPIISEIVEAEERKISEHIRTSRRISREQLYDELNDAIAIAKLNGNANAMIAGIMGKAKIAGFLIDRIQAEGEIRYVVRLPALAETTEEWLRNVEAGQKTIEGDFTVNDPMDLLPPASEPL